MTITFDIPADHLAGDVPVLDAETSQDGSNYWHLRWTIDISRHPEETKVNRDVIVDLLVLATFVIVLLLAVHIW